MKTFQLLICTLLLVALSLALNSAALAQKNSLPTELTEKSSLADVLNWLDKTSFDQARIGLEANASGVEPDETPTTAARYYEWAFFSKGFKLAGIDGCRLTLRNENVKLIKFETKYPDPAKGSLDNFRKIQNNQTQFTGEFTIPLQKLKANKAPFRYTEKSEAADLLGIWRTEFKWKPDFFLIPSKKKLKSLLENQMKIKITGAGQDARNDSMTGDEITFTFDDKRMSESFYTAFSRAILLCRGD